MISSATSPPSVHRPGPGWWATQQSPNQQSSERCSPRLVIGPSVIPRKALLAGLSLEDGQTLAIKGPPGSGKTTLIQSLVASLWVEGALAGGEPPVIHACTSNNRAFENILETFQRSLGGAEPGNPLAERWTPGPQGYGLAMPSQHAAGKHREKGFPLALRGYPSWQELPAISHDQKAVNDGARHYLEAARRAFGKGEARTLEGVVETLHGLLKQVHSQGGEILARSVRSHHAREATGLPEHREYLRALEDRRTALDHEIPDLRRLVSEIDEAITSVTFWEDLLAFLPPIRARRDDKVLGPFRRRGWECLPELGGSAYREVARTAAAEALSEAREERLRIEVRMAEEHELVQRISALSQWLPYGGEEADVPGLVQRALDSEMELEQLLDRTLRRRLFHLAARYWEGRWLREVLALHDSDPDFGRRQGEAACRQRFRRFAKLTPISVSTFFMLPRLFDYFDPEAGEGRPLTECLDLLIVDEAGQTLSEVGAPALQYAKRAVVVGDRYQIEPIWGIDRVLDRANQKRAGIDLEGSKGDAFRCSGEGSLMLLAERASRLGEEDGSPGIMLTEHWRCRPEIIEYCTQLVYGRLEPKRSPASDPYLPCFGWAHLAHRAQKRRGSWVNPGHAWAIAEWLHRRRSELEEQYGALANIGIVTPFRPQAIEIGRALRDFDLKTIEVGTVHTFQGGEKDLVLFSPTYSADSPPNYFFDITPNMLNVAVSRARESFLVFGDMSIFRPPVAGQGAGTPSGLLAKFLFARPEQEITDVESVPPPPDRARARRIDTLEGHRQHLRRAFGEVRERLLVVSPYLTSKAVEADEVPALIRHARNRQVRVVVAYCRDLQQEDRAKEAKTWLEEAGAEVLALDRIHQKSLAVDDRWIVEGSFNWLSASRNPESRYHRAEASMLCHAPDAVEMIDRVWQLVETRWGALGIGGG